MCLSPVFCEVTDHDTSRVAKIITLKKTLRHKQLLGKHCLIMLFCIDDDFSAPSSFAAATISGRAFSMAPS